MIRLDLWAHMDLIVYHLVSCLKVANHVLAPMIEYKISQL